MADEIQEAPSYGGRRVWFFQMNVIEWIMIGALLFILGLTSVDAMEGSRVGKGDAVDIAKLEGRQGMVAISISK
jgi:hypothetical protein